MGAKTKIGVATTVVVALVSYNNPGNIEKSKYHWLGQVQDHSSKPYVSFSQERYGYRAMAITLLSYEDTHRLMTVPSIITRYAPPSDNNPTENYIAFVLGQTHFQSNQILDLHDPVQLTKLVKAMTQFEKGRHFIIRQSELDAGIQMAYEERHVRTD